MSGDADFTVPSLLDWLTSMARHPDFFRKLGLKPDLPTIASCSIKIAAWSESLLARLLLSEILGWSSSPLSSLSS